MPVRYTCPECQDTGVVPDEMAGKEATCSCGQILTVPPLGAVPIDEPALPLHRTGLDRRVSDRRKSENGLPAVDRREVVDRRGGTDRRDAPREPRRAKLVFLPLVMGALGFALGLAAVRAASLERLDLAEERLKAAIALETGGQGLIHVKDAAIASARAAGGPAPSPVAVREVTRLEEERSRLVEEARTAPARRAEAEREIGATRFSWWIGGALLGAVAFFVTRFLVARAE